MYQVSIFNNGTETIIHTPNPDIDAPHILSLPLKESLSQPEQLSFLLQYNNPGFNLIEGLTTKVKVLDTRDNSIVFSGRVIPTKDGMSYDGKFNKEVTCEGALAYLNDTNTRRWRFANKTPQDILQYLLDQHNSKMDNARKINLGTIEITQPITIDTNYESTLNAVITKVRNILGGDIRVQERNGLLYLDYLLAQGTNNGVKVKIGYNLKELIRDYDPMDIITRAIPLGYGEGINQLGITSVNSGVEYIEDATSKAKYGVIEGVVTNKDIQDPTTLKLYGQVVLTEKSQPRFTYQISHLDLSVLTGHENEKYDLGDTLETIVDPLSVDVLSRVIERDRDLIVSPWDPTLTISTRAIRLSDQIVDLRQRSQTLENAPQGSTYIDTYGYADNIDSVHSFQLPVWVSPDILNVNRIRLHIDGQKYRAYEKSVSEVSSSTLTAYVEKWGNPGTEINAPSEPVTGDEQIAMMDWLWDTTYQGCYRYTMPSYGGDSPLYVVAKSNNFAPIADGEIYAWTDLFKTQHRHDYTHSHNNRLDYGIFEDTYPKDVYVKVNGQTVAGPLGTGVAFNVDLDLTQYISTPGQTYNLEITSSQNGRVNVWVSVQAFIQAR